MLRMFAIAVLCGFLAAQPLAAAQPTELTWDDLLPPQAREPVNPFPELTREQQVKLYGIAQILMRKEQGQLSEVSREYEFAVEDMHELEGQGVDVDAQLVKLNALIAEIAEAGRAIKAELDGKTVKIPGYALPLEHSGLAVTELLLVPYVGACIHVPPPPENQIVHVRLDAPFVPENLYTPVWITGRMQAKRKVSQLDLVDGRGVVSSGYAIDAGRITPYTEN
ncbi:MAG: DUF3299 domain-containing protein [Acetobacterales bacterium]